MSQLRAKGRYYGENPHHGRHVDRRIGRRLAQDVEKGATIFKKWALCHKIGPGATNLVGPILNCLDGRHSGSVAGFNYSDANKNSGLTWDEATLTKYLKNPKEVVPGTKMAFPGLHSDDEIADVIAYLKQFGPDGKKM